jgi:transcriptional regulator with XRE-family HTH domain
MTGQELRTIRQGLRLSVIEMGLALGYQGNDNTLSVQIRRYELGERPIPPWIARLARMYARFGIPEGQKNSF